MTFFVLVIPSNRFWFTEIKFVTGDPDIVGFDSSFVYYHHSTIFVMWF